MARIEVIKSARKERKCSKCGNTIAVGQSYYKATPYRRPTIYRCTTCGLKSYETSGSEFVREVGSIVENWGDSFGVCETTADEITSVLEELRDQTQENLDNMPGQLQGGDTGMMLQERIEMLEDTISELENVSWENCECDARDEVLNEMGEFDPDAEDSEWETESDYNEDLDSRVSEITEQKFSDAIDEALSGLSY